MIAFSTIIFIPLFAEQNSEKAKKLGSGGLPIKTQLVRAD